MPFIEFDGVETDVSLPKLEADDVPFAAAVDEDPAGTTAEVAEYSVGVPVITINPDNGQAAVSGTYQQPNSAGLALSVCHNSGNTAHPSPFTSAAFSSLGLQNIDLLTKTVIGTFSFPGISAISCSGDDVWVSGSLGVRRVNNTDPRSPNSPGGFFFFPTPSGVNALGAVLYNGANNPFLFVASPGQTQSTVFVFVFNGTQITQRNFTIPAFVYEFAFQPSDVNGNRNILHTAALSAGLVTTSLEDPDKPRNIPNPTTNTNTATTGVSVVGRFVITTDTSAGVTAFYPVGGQLNYAGKFTDLPGLTYKGLVRANKLTTINAYGSLEVSPMSSVQPTASPPQGTGSFVFSLTKTPSGQVVSRDYTSVQMRDPNTQQFYGSCDIPKYLGIGDTDTCVDTRGIIFTIDANALYAADPTRPQASCRLSTNSAAAGRGVVVVGTTVYTVGAGKFSAWDYSNPASPGSTPLFQITPGDVKAIKIPASYDKAYIVLTLSNGKSHVQCYDITQSAPALLWQSDALSSAPLSLDITADGKTLVGTATTGLSVIDNASRKIIGVFNPPGMATVASVVAHPDGYALAVSQEKGRVHVIDLANCQAGDCPLNFEAGRHQGSGYLGQAVLISPTQLLVANGDKGYFSLKGIVPKADPQLSFPGVMSIAPGQAVPLTKRFVTAIATATTPPIPNSVPIPFNGLTFFVPETRGVRVEMSNNRGTAITAIPGSVIPDDLDAKALAQPYAVVVADLPPATGTQADPVLMLNPGVKVGQLQTAKPLPMQLASGNPTVQFPQTTIAEDGSVPVVLRLLDSNGVATTSPEDKVVFSNTDVTVCFWSLSSAPKVPITFCNPALHCNPNSGAPQLLFNKPKGSKLPASTTLTGTVGAKTSIPVTIDKNTKDAGGNPLLTSTFTNDPAVITKVPTPATLTLNQAGASVDATALFVAINPNFPADNSPVTMTISELEGATPNPPTFRAGDTVRLSPSPLYQSEGVFTGKFCGTTATNPTPSCQVFSGTFTNIHQLPTQVLVAPSGDEGVPVRMTTEFLIIRNDGRNPRSQMSSLLRGNGCAFGAPGTEYSQTYTLSANELDLGSRYFKCNPNGVICVQTTDAELTTDEACVDAKIIPAPSNALATAFTYFAYTSVAGLGVAFIRSKFIDYFKNVLHDVLVEEEVKAIRESQTSGNQKALFFFHNLVRPVVILFMYKFSTTRFTIRTKEETEAYIAALKKILDKLNELNAFKWKEYDAHAPDTLWLLGNILLETIEGIREYLHLPDEFRPFYKPGRDLTPEQLGYKAGVLNAKEQDELNKRSSDIAATIHARLDGALNGEAPDVNAALAHSEMARSARGSVSTRDLPRTPRPTPNVGLSVDTKRGDDEAMAPQLNGDVTAGPTPNGGLGVDTKLDDDEAAVPLLSGDASPDLAKISAYAAKTSAKVIMLDTKIGAVSVRVIKLDTRTQRLEKVAQDFEDMLAAAAEIYGNIKPLPPGKADNPAERINQCLKIFADLNAKTARKASAKIPSVKPESRLKAASPPASDEKRAGSGDSAAARAIAAGGSSGSPVFSAASPAATTSPLASNRSTPSSGGDTPPTPSTPPAGKDGGAVVIELMQQLPPLPPPPLSTGGVASIAAGGSANGRSPGTEMTGITVVPRETVPGPPPEDDSADAATHPSSPQHRAH